MESYRQSLILITSLLYHYRILARLAGVQIPLL